MSKRWGSDYVVTEHRDLQVKKNKKTKQRAVAIVHCFVYC